jgi:hypothetical protein
MAGMFSLKAAPTSFKVLPLAFPWGRREARHSRGITRGYEQAQDQGTEGSAKRDAGAPISAWTARPYL